MNIALLRFVHCRRRSCKCFIKILLANQNQRTFAEHKKNQKSIDFEIDKYKNSEKNHALHKSAFIQ